MSSCKCYTQVKLLNTENTNKFMKNKEKSKTLPNWFNGEVYKEGAEVTNPYSGCSCYLNAEELSMYDFIKGSEMLLEGGFREKNIVNSFYNAIDWFRIANEKAYMILLD
jgi:hypothetical protein